MGLYVEFGGSLTPRDEKSEEEIKKALDIFNEYEKHAWEYIVRGYDTNYDRKSYEKLAEVFDGEIEFNEGDEDSPHWTLSFEDGKVSVAPESILTAIIKKLGLEEK